MVSKVILHDAEDHVTAAILAKVFQGKEEKAALARHCAQIAIRAHWEWGDQQRSEWLKIDIHQE